MKIKEKEVGIDCKFNFVESICLNFMCFEESIKMHCRRRNLIFVVDIKVETVCCNKSVYNIKEKIKKF